MVHSMRGAGNTCASRFYDKKPHHATMDFSVTIGYVCLQVSVVDKCTDKDGIVTIVLPVKFFPNSRCGGWAQTIRYLVEVWLKGTDQQSLGHTKREPQLD